MVPKPILLDLNAIVQQLGAIGSFAYSLRLPPSEGLTPEGPVEVSLEVQNTGSALLVRGSFRGKVRLSCARCLEEVVAPAEGRIAEEFSLPGGAAELELIDQIEPEESAYAEQILNVSELIRQQLLISQPLRALCSPDCKGLCPRCGHNLNLGECSCPKVVAHPAWEALRVLKDLGKE